MRQAKEFNHENRRRRRRRIELIRGRVQWLATLSGGLEAVEHRIVHGSEKTIFIVSLHVFGKCRVYSALAVLRRLSRKKLQIAATSTRDSCVLYEQKCNNTARCNFAPLLLHLKQILQKVVEITCGLRSSELFKYTFQYRRYITSNGITD